MTAAPAHVVALARERAAARIAGDYAAADRLRDLIAAAGWAVDDFADGFTLTEQPAYPVVATLADLPRGGEPTRRVGVGLLVEGWPADLRQCVAALLDNVPGDVAVVGLDVGNVDGAGDELHALAVEHPGRVQEWHVATSAGWGPAQTALARLDTAHVHVLMDVSTVFDGDALTPLLEALAGPGVVAAGWQGAMIDLADDWRSVTAAAPGEVDVLLGYLMVVRRQALLDVGGPHPKARFYRNADLELSLMLRARGGRLVVPEAELLVHQERHRGYHDSEPEYRERESRRTYARMLAAFRGQPQILAPRA